VASKVGKVGKTAGKGISNAGKSGLKGIEGAGKVGKLAGEKILKDAKEVGEFIKKGFSKIPNPLARDLLLASDIPINVLQLQKSGHDLIQQIKKTFDVNHRPKGKAWEDMPVSGKAKIAPNGQRIMSIRELKSFKKEMHEQNIKVIIDKKDNILPNNVAAGFNPETGEIVLRREPTYLSALHESYHAKQWSKLGKEKYLKQSVLEREEYVYNEIMKNKDKFSNAEVLFSQRYIYKLRFGNWPPHDWKGFKE
ncbi:zincin-like metallopeptidase toxin domain-containing protein, partial [Bacillus sp. z60-18]|uniref:zincin-like metallopeptidase toxin domain-containing protein n=1 Tax=unclassified Bacillus (in: firmicutes) TaxID=185979 RepID=UPI00390C9726